MRYVYIFFQLTLFVACTNAQDTIRIKTCTTYSLNDTTAIDLDDTTEIKKYLWNKKYYNREGKLTEEVEFPFPHNSSFTTTKITTKDYIQDTTITYVYTGTRDKVSETFSYSNSAQNFTRTINYATLTMDSYRKLDRTYIVEVTQDSLNNLVTVIQMYEDGADADTIRSYQYPMAPSNTESLGQPPAKYLVPMDTLRSTALSVYGYFLISSQDTTYTYHKKEIKIDDTTKLIEILEIKIDNEIPMISKKSYLLNNGHIQNSNKAWLVNNKWSTAYNEYNEYDHYGNKTLGIRDDYRDGVFSYRFVTYTKYEYYD